MSERMSPVRGLWILEFSPFQISSSPFGFQQCEDLIETLKPCEAHQNKFPYAKRECSILYSDVFAPCRNVVNECFH